MTTRREIITSGLGLAGIIAAGRAPAAFVRSMVAARSAAFGGDAAKPYDYEVNYIENHFTEYIDTGHYSKNVSGIYFNGYIFLGTPIQDVVAIGSKNRHGERFWINPSSTGSLPSIYCGWNGYFNTHIAYDYSTRIEIFHNYKNSRSFRYNNSADLYQSSYAYALHDSDVTDYIFAANISGSAQLKTKLKVVNVKISDSDSIVRDFIPVVKDGVGYLYDRCGSICPITGTSLYANAGDGAFTWG